MTYNRGNAGGDRDDPDDMDGAYVPVHAGAWEPVLAALVIEAQWDQIAETARDLRQQQEQREQTP